MIWFEGKDHRYTISEREKFLKEITTRLPDQFVLLTTCNRVELYAGDGEIPQSIALHLFRVAAGIESKMIGETHIQAQVKRAYTNAIDEGYISSGLHGLFQAALKTGKRVRTETRISHGVVSHAQATVELLLRETDRVNDKTILVIGAHHLSERIIGLLKRIGCKGILLTNRTQEKGIALSERVGCAFIAFEDVNLHFKEVDIIITCTASPQPILRKEDITREMKLLIIDLAVPRDVEETVSANSGVRLFNLEDVENGIDQNIDNRRKEIVKAEKIIHEEVDILCTTRELAGIIC